MLSALIQANHILIFRDAGTGTLFLHQHEVAVIQSVFKGLPPTPLLATWDERDKKPAWQDGGRKRSYFSWLHCWEEDKC